MRPIIYRTLSFLGLLLTILPSILVFLRLIGLPASKTLMLLGTLLWFSTAPLWLNKRSA